MGIDPATLRARRLTLIARAVEHLDTTPRHDLLRQLGHPDVRLHSHFKEDPAGLADQLRAVTSTDYPGHVFGSFKAAQNVLRAAGLPYMPDDYAIQAEGGQESEDR